MGLSDAGMARSGSGKVALVGNTVDFFDIGVDRRCGACEGVRVENVVSTPFVRSGTRRPGVHRALRTPAATRARLPELPIIS